VEKELCCLRNRHSGQSPILIAYFNTCFIIFFGLPIGSGRTRRPISFSHLLRKLSLPSGLPVCVFSRNRATCCSSIPSASSSRHWLADIMLYQQDSFSSSDSACLSMCGAALDHSYRHGLRQSFTLTGLSSIYRIASQKWRSSSAHE